METTLVATARYPERTDGLRISTRGGTLVVGVGISEIARVTWPEACPLRVEVRDGRLYVQGRTYKLRSDTLERMPIVTSPLAIG